ncbi:adenylate/guanylate cyclase domain-containing protein [Bradyrhizobium sp. 62B]|uniref:adenylate/guanylate cyclase domain-containing protein n=1 Tax=Bradyrhizobium TaxID=374 RepID=UPI001886D6BF|nr:MULTISPECIES: adenylate/guanylate cyclase domain-containing protein [Bradyrhizobium]WIW46811.1 adenylate/guanylate cyclase domain-containing protein [Bradyrhizobium sp. 62B]MBR0931291.1 GAF domain-containing protein [Bradyrhizobium diazoefficiens]MCS3761469.1 class 3 adenylate cyclase/HAMP domain-containing protein [Bradyrhizobium centrosematis]MCS3774137.1 class 3 adenylate cyclase/HAMP domain-containing protein [Bradyrhizobium centrosematis]MDT4739967.1 adenylate/guanylate cyclase domain-
MAGANDKTRSLRGGLFAKYVVSLVGLVVFVLAVNGAMETWISYRATKTQLTDGLEDKAQSAARRIEQSISELDRQISWVTRASQDTLEKRRADYASLLHQVSVVNQLFQLNGEGREVLRVSRQSTTTGSNADLSRDIRFTETVARGVSYAPAWFAGGTPLMSISVAHSGFNAGVTVAEIDLGFLSDFLSDAQVGKAAFAYVVDPRGRVLATSSKGPEVGKDLSKLPQVAAAIAPGHEGDSTGTDFNGHSVMSAASTVPKLGWSVLFEQPTTQALMPIRDQLVRIALLIGIGLMVAILAGTLLARRMIIPITALRDGAQLLGEGDFSHRIDVHTSDELEDLAGQFNRMAGQIQETYSNLETKVEERTRDLAQSINELKVLEEVGRALAASLDLNAVLSTIAARAIEITHADAVLIYGFDAERRRFNLVEAGGIDKSADGAHVTIDDGENILSDAAGSGEPIALADLEQAAEQPLREVALAAGFHSVLVVPLVDQQGTLGSLVVLRRAGGEFAPSIIGLMRTFANQAVLAMRNARLFTEVDHKGRELGAANETVRAQADQLRRQTEQLKDWNKSLEERVQTQLGEIERIRKLERFLAPQVAQLIASSDSPEGLLTSQRREVTVVFCDLRGFTAFTEATEPEEAMNVLREYHAALGELIFKYEGTLDKYAGDGVMILFNAPIQFEDHTRRAVKMAVEMRDTIGPLTERWRNRGHSLGFGIGIALGYATLGQVGFEQRLEYAAIGSVTNLASRLCGEAKPNQIVVSRRVYGMVEPWVEAQPLDDLQLKGFNHPVLAMEILSWHEEADNVVDAAAVRMRG